MLADGINPGCESGTASKDHAQKESKSLEEEGPIRIGVETLSVHITDAANHGAVFQAEYTKDETLNRAPSTDHLQEQI